jgi:hypothetical protein
MMIWKYWNEIETAIERHAANRSQDEKQDIRQTVYLTLLAGKRVTTKKKALKIARESVLQYIQEQKKEGKEESLSEPGVFRMAEEQQAQEFDTSGGLDLEAAIERLPAADQIIIRMFYGLAGEAQTIASIAHWFGKPGIWVRRRKKLAVEKLKILLGE